MINYKLQMFCMKCCFDVVRFYRYLMLIMVQTRLYFFSRMYFLLTSFISAPRDCALVLTLESYRMHHALKDRRRGLP